MPLLSILPALEYRIAPFLSITKTLLSWFFILYMEKTFPSQSPYIVSPSFFEFCLSLFLHIRVNGQNAPEQLTIGTPRETSEGKLGSRASSLRAFFRALFFSTTSFVS